MRLFHRSCCFEFVRVGLMTLVVLGLISHSSLANWEGSDDELVERKV